jgi:hypothetical protein
MIDSECEVLGREYPAQMLILVDHKHAVGPFGRTKLGSIGDCMMIDFYESDWFIEKKNIGMVIRPVMLSGTVRAGRGLKADTVPACLLGRGPPVPPVPVRFWPGGRLRCSSFSIFFLMACVYIWLLGQQKTMILLSCTCLVPSALSLAGLAECALEAGMAE